MNMLVETWHVKKWDGKGPETFWLHRKYLEQAKMVTNYDD